MGRIVSTAGFISDASFMNWAQSSAREFYRHCISDVLYLHENLLYLGNFLATISIPSQKFVSSVTRFRSLHGVGCVTAYVLSSLNRFQEPLNVLPCSWPLLCCLAQLAVTHPLRVRSRDLPRLRVVALGTVVVMSLYIWKIDRQDVVSRGERSSLGCDGW